MLLRRRMLLRAAAVRRMPEGQAPPAESQPVPTQNPAPAHGLASEDINRLAELGQLHRDGVLTDEEFAQEKARILE